jgi:Fe-S cluster biogenesis protein NfuA
MNLEEKIKKALDDIRPSLQADGGDLEFVDWKEKEGVLQVRMTGMCATCPMAQMTLKQGIEKEVQKQVSEVKEVQSV